MEVFKGSKVEWISKLHVFNELEWMKCFCRTVMVHISSLSERNTSAKTLCSENVFIHMIFFSYRYYNLELTIWSDTVAQKIGNYSIFFCHHEEDVEKGTIAIGLTFPFGSCLNWDTINLLIKFYYFQQIPE